MDEQILIGNQNRMIIRDGAVHRPSHPWSDGIRRLLQFCRTEDLEFVPEWRGQDEQGNEIFEYQNGREGIPNNGQARARLASFKARDS
jgi:hypothetical protein